jgi:hypothetical protein
MPLFGQLVPETEAVTFHEYVPALAYACVGFCCVDVWPSPKFQRNVGEPLQPLGVAVA